VAYTRDYDVTTPADGDLLSSGDDAIRDFKVDVEERLLSVYKDIDVDPLEPKDASIPGAALKDGAVTFTQLDPTLNLRSIIIQSVSVSGVVAAGAISGGGGPFTVDGAEEGDVAVCSWADGRFAVMAAVTGPDEVTVAFANITAGSITLADQTLLIAVIKAGIPGTLHGDLNPKIGATEFQPADQSVPAVYTVDYVTLGANGPMTFYAVVPVAAGRIINTARIAVESLNSATIVGRLYKIAGGVSTQLDVDILPTTGGGGQQVDISPAYTVVDGDEIVFEITLDSTSSAGADDAKLYWVQLLLS